MLRKFLLLMVLAAMFSGFAQPLPAQGVKAEVLARTEQTWNNTPLPDYPEQSPEITILRIRVEPGVRLPVHRHPVINAGYMLEGELTVVTEDGDELVLKAGEAIVEVVNTWHYGINTGDGPAEIVVFYAGSRGTPITVEK
ncbi:MAG: cupin domain-containing protein [Desulfonatronovibrionaceae bacterium]